MPTREEYIAKFKAQLDKWNAELELLEAKARKASADMKVEYQQQIQSLQHQRDKARARLTELRQASDSSWEDLKEGSEQAWKAFREGLERARSRFK